MGTAIVRVHTGRHSRRVNSRELEEILLKAEHDASRLVGVEELDVRLRPGRRRTPHDLAREAARRAVRSGKLQRRPCQVCGDARSQAHHEDYSKPLDVLWLCSRHHIELHHKKNFRANAGDCPGPGTIPDCFFFLRDPGLPAGTGIRSIRRLRRGLRWTQLRKRRAVRGRQAGDRCLSVGLGPQFKFRVVAPLNLRHMPEALVAREDLLEHEAFTDLVPAQAFVVPKPDDKRHHGPLRVILDSILTAGGALVTEAQGRFVIEFPALSPALHFLPHLGAVHDSDVPVPEHRPLQFAKPSHELQEQPSKLRARIHWAIEHVYPDTLLQPSLKVATRLSVGAKGPVEAGQDEVVSRPKAE